MGNHSSTKQNAEKDQQQYNNQLPMSQIKFSLWDEMNQKEDCQALTFNNEGTLLATTIKQDIKIWNVDDGKLIDQNIILKGHTSLIRCLVFSCKQNWLISGGDDLQIRCWKENDKNNWQSSTPFQKHKNYVYNMILNQNEDELISCSADHSIKIWQANAQENKIEFSYSLDKHEHFVYQISLNSNETQLVSCSMDKQIFIWQKDENKHWKFKNKIEKSVDDYGFRVGFLTDNLIAWTQYQSGYLYIFQQENEQFIEMPKMKIALKSQNSSDIYILFPLIFNRQKQIMIIRHNKYVSLFQLESNNQLKVVGEPIDCQSSDNYGTLSNDGKNLVIWNDATKQLKVYKLQYP